MSTIKNLFIGLKDTISPKKCFLCRHNGLFLCKKCELLYKQYMPYCYICKKESQDFKIHKNCLLDNKKYHGANFNEKKIYLDRVLVWTHYKYKIIKKLITHFKFRGKKDIGIELSERLVKIIQTNILNKGEKKSDYLVLPVPLHWFKRVLRGFNQTEIIAFNIGQYTDIEYCKNTIKKKKYTRQQSKFSRQERLKNLENAFKISKKHKDKIDKKIIILIDDVVSSGTTLNEIAKELKKNGAKKVIGVCLASD